METQKTKTEESVILTATCCGCSETDHKNQAENLMVWGDQQDIETLSDNRLSVPRKPNDAWRPASVWSHKSLDGMPKTTQKGRDIFYHYILVTCPDCMRLTVHLCEFGTSNWRAVEPKGWRVNVTFGFEAPSKSQVTMAHLQKIWIETPTRGEVEKSTMLSFIQHHNQPTNRHDREIKKFWESYLMTKADMARHYYEGWVERNAKLHGYPYPDTPEDFLFDTDVREYMKDCAMFAPHSLQNTGEVLEATMDILRQVLDLLNADQIQAKTDLIQAAAKRQEENQELVNKIFN